MWDKFFLEWETAKEIYERIFHILNNKFKPVKNYSYKNGSGFGQNSRYALKSYNLAPDLHRHLLDYDKI